MLVESHLTQAMLCHAKGGGGGGVVTQRHDGVRNLLTSLLSKVYKNVQVEPHLQPLDNEVMNLRSATSSSYARSDAKAGGFWSRRVTAFFDVSVTHVNSSLLLRGFERERQRLRDRDNRARGGSWDHGSPRFLPPSQRSPRTHHSLHQSSNIFIALACSPAGSP